VRSPGGRERKQSVTRGGGGVALWWPNGACEYPTVSVPGSGITHTVSVLRAHAATLKVTDDDAVVIRAGEKTVRSRRTSAPRGLL